MKTSDKIFLIAAFISFLLSVILWFNGQQNEGIFVGLWVPSILICANYIKQIGRDINQQS